MIKYAIIINKKTKQCNVGIGTNIKFYQSIGMTEMDVEQSEIDNTWYLKGYCHHYTEDEIIQQKESEFNEKFFETSLGYVRRKVTMKDNTTVNFLTDILPLLQIGVPIITYNKPDFTKSELPTQNTNVLVTEEFITECKQQMLKDFYGDSSIDIRRV